MSKLKYQANTVTEKKTRISKVIEYNGGKYYSYIEYGMNLIEGNSEPYFSIVKKLGKWRSLGPDSQFIEKYFPEFAELCPYHLALQNTGLPLYYVESGIYCFKIWKEEQNEKNEQILKNNILYKKEENWLSNDLELSDFQSILEERIPQLQKDFHETMKRFGVEYITV